MTVGAQAPCRIAAELVVIDRRVDVIRDEEIDATIVVEVRKRAARAPQGKPDSGFLRDVVERPVTVVVIQDVRAQVRNVEIVEAIVVVVSGAGAHAVLTVTDARLRRDVLERSVLSIPKQPVARSTRHLRIGQRAAIDEKHIDPAIVVVVEAQSAGPHNRGEVLLRAAAVRVDEVQSGGAGDVLKRDRRGLRSWRRRSLITVARNENASQHESKRQYSGFHREPNARSWSCLNSRYSARSRSAASF